ncbi:PREDICTED: piggyBac transposable element-derived protein 4-like [Eufriesea mexicana]|uniref:piggyBac transposable element-derived protein 4-like n=1 Tax=Eufriesea mexicana TaxID=516756 RepID=UPI00083C08DA|nr:PREDICTED: piggyBac transposable element-derived protein 4-like [Eufriesea mexicana]XP_017762896.1 PREDICTED: piggyBac transposable element-derived protein 4-like [Eufriesea mexicana]
MDMGFSDSSDESVFGIMPKRRRNRILSSSSSDTATDRNTTEEEVWESDEEQDDDAEWRKIVEKSASEEECSDGEELLMEETDCDDPVAIYKLFFTDEILETIVEETNRYAVQCMVNAAYGRRQHQQRWNPVTTSELNTFIGILLIMGVVQVPELRLYWSNKAMYANARIKKAMKRDRFLAILKYLHFSDNATARTEDRLHKLRNVVDKIIRTFKDAVKPGKNITDTHITCIFIPEKQKRGF